MITYFFQTTQLLTQQQIDYINDMLLHLPTTDPDQFLDIPEQITEISGITEITISEE